MSSGEKKGRIGSSFDAFLDEQGIRAEIESGAIKAIIADQIRVAMKEEDLTKVTMAAKMGTARSQLDRLLDPKNESVTLATLQRAAQAIGRKLSIELR